MFVRMKYDYKPRAQASVRGVVSKAAAPDEPEITPEMVEAGLLVFAGHDPDIDPAEVAVEDIYRAMERARIKPLTLQGRRPSSC
jgi:hypothetical protein